MSLRETVLSFAGGRCPVRVLAVIPAVILLLGGCAMSGTKTTGKGSPAMVGLANPASVHCQKKGGRLEMKEDAQGGQYALCHLPDGRIIEEWALFRQDHKVPSR